MPLAFPNLIFTLGETFHEDSRLMPIYEYHHVDVGLLFSSK